MARDCITLSLDEVTFKVLRERAEAMDMKKSVLIRTALEWLLEKYDKGETLHMRGLSYIQDCQQQARTPRVLMDRIADVCDTLEWKKSDFYVTAIKTYIEHTLHADATVKKENLWRI